MKILKVRYVDPAMFDYGKPSFYVYSDYSYINLELIREYQEIDVLASISFHTNHFNSINVAFEQFDVLMRSNVI